MSISTVSREGEKSKEDPPRERVRVEKDKCELLSKVGERKGGRERKRLCVCVSRRDRE